MLNYFRDIRLMGALSIFISISTWIMDIMHLVEACPYCQTERTVIGLLGILMILPSYRFVTPWLTLVLGIFGTHVACAQIFMHTRVYEFNDMFTILATCALCILSAQMLVLFRRAYS